MPRFRTTTEMISFAFSDKSEAVTSSTLSNGHLSVTWTGGLIQLVKFPTVLDEEGKRYRDGEVMGEELINDDVMGLSRKSLKSIVHTNGKHIFSVSGQELKYYASDMTSAQTLEKCSVKDIEVVNHPSSDYLVS
jgi:hypothetical protein